MTTGLLHVLGGSHWQTATVRLAKALGYRVLVTDYFTERPAYAHADHHEVVDITDREATLEVARRYRIDGILCDTTDVGVPTGAYVAEQLGLPGMGYEVARNFTHKGWMRRLTRQAGLDTPPFILLRRGDGLDGAVDAIPLPLIVKPVDSQSGKGVRIVRTAVELASAVEQAMRHSREGTVLIEAVVHGEEIIVDGFMREGVAGILGIARKTPNPKQPTVSARITYGHAVPPETRARIEAVNQRALAALGLRDGVFHAEYMLAGERVIPIDIAARGGGCMIYTHVLPQVSGVDANEAMIRLAMGESAAIKVTRHRAANIEFFHLPQGVLAALEGQEDCACQPGVLALHCNVAVGDRIGPLWAKDDRPGYIVAGGDTAESAIATSLAAKSCLRARIGEDTVFRSVL
jgi:biotin carboxylase